MPDAFAQVTQAHRDFRALWTLANQLRVSKAGVSFLLVLTLLHCWVCVCRSAGYLVPRDNVRALGRVTGVCDECSGVPPWPMAVHHSRPVLDRGKRVVYAILKRILKETVGAG